MGARWSAWDRTGREVARPGHVERDGDARTGHEKRWGRRAGRSYARDGGKMAALRTVDARRHVRPAGRGGGLVVTTDSGRPPRVSSKSRAQWSGLRYVSGGGRDPSGTILHN